jgi:hypothetical protein
MERLRNAFIEEFKKLDHSQKVAALTFIRKMVDENNHRRIGALRRKKKSQNFHNTEEDLQ